MRGKEVANTDSECVVPDRVDTENSIESGAKAVREQNMAIRTMLTEVDENNKLDGAPSLVDTWDRISNFRDINDLVRINMLEVQHMLQEAFEEHQKSKIDDNDRLRSMLDMAKADSKFADSYAKELQLVKIQRNDERKTIQSLAATGLQLAKEYRQCAMQRAMFVHIAMIQQFALLITASIQRNVKDPTAWKSISEDIQQFKRICFPAQEERIKE